MWRLKFGEVSTTSTEVDMTRAGKGDPRSGPHSDSIRIEWVPVGTLRTNPRNARTHSRKQRRQIAASIRKHGFLNPIIVDEDNVILAGHGRLEAATGEALTHVPIIRFTHLTAAQKRAYLIADNRIAEQAGWNREMLAIELGELIDLLPAEGFDVSLTGFETAEIDLLLADMANAKQEPEDIIPPLPQKPISQRGDLWLLGKHRLFCGDAQQPDNFQRLMNGKSASAVFLTHLITGRQARSAGVAVFSIPTSLSLRGKWVRRDLENSCRPHWPMASMFRSTARFILSASTGVRLTP